MKDVPFQLIEVVEVSTLLLVRSSSYRVSKILTEQYENMVLVISSAVLNFLSNFI